MAFLVTDVQLKALLQSIKRVAVVGLSNKPERASHHVSTFLKGVGLQVVGVNPALAGKTVEGIAVYGSLSDLEGHIDVVDVFRSSDAVPEIVAECVALRKANPHNVKALWLQEGVVHDVAEAEAVSEGIDLVSDKCMLKEWKRLGLPSSL